ncbi:NAD(P)/FAD-dependent oxidoreductase [Nitratireductor sp. XY-223]|uniref:NAD(P)/FAD-dependent oxidoreductase n=1 Tax=Nitratireductor sp. XY-223 TaxID=2561926 RepID=UPI0010A9F4D1|nr:NAD(P)/FAD-dependent oxidoreductase [Nitratireductor sp. XY-223]
MRHADTIIIGGGPAGSTCAGRLVKAGREVLVIDKASFPRLKLCAGWITEKVMADLEFTEHDYPHPLLKLDVRSHFPKVPFGLNWFPTKGENFSIRRTEFDAWLLQRSGAPVENHAVKSIRREDGRYIIDDAYSCDHLVGAGGTMCPVRRNLFDDERRKALQIATLEKEFEYPDRRDDCHLYFARRGLVGYAWFVPKGNGFVNIGIGGKSKYFRKSGTSIHDHFRWFLDDLVRDGRLDAQTADGLKATGHPYFLYAWDGPVKKDRCYLIGDSAGLASIDLGEGIGPAVESALMAAREILGEGDYTKRDITYYSLGGLTERLLKRFVPPKGMDTVDAPSPDPVDGTARPA